LLDLGLPLEADAGEAVEPPNVAGLDGSDDRLLGIVLSHSHPDHYGLIETAALSIPVFMGAATARILKEAKFFTPMGLDGPVGQPLVDRQPISVGDFTITPLLVDHSAFDAYALLIEADGRKLFYSGDLRAHGRKADVFRALLKQPPSEVNALLLEGTTISRDGDSQPLSELDVEQRCREEIRLTKGMLLACYSAQNIDRFVSVFKATIKEGRDLIVDLYGASIAAATQRETIPQGHWDRLRVYVPQAQRVKVKQARQFKRVNELGASRIYQEEIAEEPGKWVMSFRTSMAAELDRAGALNDARAIWMMWPGYLEGEAGERVVQVFQGRDIPLSRVHASGHAAVEDLQRLASAIAADRVIPIHTAVPERYPALFDRVEAHRDGEWWNV
jgi:ribonuclease J